MRNWFRNLPIKWKLSVVSLATTCSALLAASTAFFIYDQLSFRRQYLHQAVSLANVVGANSTAALTFRDAKVAEMILSTLGTQPHVMFGATYDKEDRVLAVFRRDDIRDDLLPSMIVPSGYNWYMGRLSVFVPVVLEGERIGTIFAAFSMQPVYARLGRYSAVVFTILGVSVLVAWALVNYLQSYVSRPIMHLKETAEEITAAGNFALRAPGEGPDEIGALVSGFNGMLDRIQASDAKLLKYQEQLRSLASELTLAEERERRRIAGGLHDSISQTLMAAAMKLKILTLENDKTAADKLVEETESLINASLTEARSLTFQLSPPALYEFGLKDALGRLCEQMAAEYDMNIALDAGECDAQLTEDVSVLLYRSVRELIVNAHKHASAEHVTVKLALRDGRIRIAVGDDGDGFDPEAVVAAEVAGFGLFSIRERLSSAGGEMTVVSAAGMGTTVILDAPAGQSSTAANSG